MIDPHHLMTYVIRPTLNYLELGGPDAEALLLGTALVESGGRYLAQLRGPACGLWQVEPATEDWLVNDRYGDRPEGARAMKLAFVRRHGLNPLEGSLPYSCAVARLRYRVDPRALPHFTDIPAQARYWKRVYNTVAGKGTPAKYERWGDTIREVMSNA